ncbi:MAG TPA: ATP-binding cassette domain-containing protein [Pricia sp.]|nr:ATP-binding cassette domain-containing protein [Pricia sp.]
MTLEIDNIELSFADRKILYGIYLKAETGKVTGILGRNGCGKTSLLRILFGSLKAKYGNIRIDGVHQNRKLYSIDCIAYLPQHQLLPDNLKLREAFRFFDVDWLNFSSLFTAFRAYEKDNAKSLSSGELRLVETYLILNSKKPVILLDEPFSFIAPVLVERMKDLIKQKQKESAIVMTDHFYRDILEVSDTVYFLKDGYSKLIHSTQELEEEGYLNLG